MIGVLSSAQISRQLGLNALQGSPPRRSTATAPEATDSVRIAFERTRKQTGIVPSHLVPLQEIAAQTNSIIGVRPVETVATGLIDAGHPTKNFHIKGKSANWGPQAGLICADQAFSKLEKFKHEAPEKLNRANEQVADCIRKNDAVAIPLEISQNRLGELMKLGHIAELAPTEKDGILRFSAQGPSQQVYTFEGKRTSPSADNYLISHKGKPIEVLAERAGGKPLTADYDLHMVAPHLSNYGVEDRLPLPDVAHSVLTKRVDSYRQHYSDPKAFQVPMELCEDYENPHLFYKKEDQDLGNISPRVKQMIELINHRLVGNEEPVVHHSTDAGNPMTDVAANYPATFFLPTKLGRFDEICMIHDSKEMAELVKTAKDSGYHVPLNPLWEKEVVSIKRTGFSKALRLFNQG